MYSCRLQIQRHLDSVKGTFFNHYNYSPHQRSTSQRRIFLRQSDFLWRATILCFQILVLSFSKYQPWNFCKWDLTINKVCITQDLIFKMFLWMSREILRRGTRSRWGLRPNKASNPSSLFHSHHLWLKVCQIAICSQSAPLFFCEIWCRCQHCR